ncbi:hypothetical protein PITC_067280 [Penicillium italicum]|uniref:Uncharacterized protein n=1 Tax=Penicillium italicum TaxID=40296 RepID=A0A0A2KF35_PENIT|nr:hypothetical protein PITC_067280 [Penicillium italicum]
MPYPSYESLRESSLVELNLEAHRLYWTLQDPIQSSIFVMDEVNNPAAPRQPCFLSGPAADRSSPHSHPITNHSLCEPPISSITVGVDELQDIADFWEDEHNYAQGDDPKGPCRCCGLRPPPYDVKLTIVASNKDQFVTIGDYITAVHPWLMSFRGEFLRNTGGGKPLPEDTKLMVSFPYPDNVIVENDTAWISSQSIIIFGRQRRAEEAQWL